MSKSTPSAVKFWVLASLTLVVAAFGLAALWPAVPVFARSQSQAFTRAAGADRGEAAADYQLAVWLNPGNRPARLGLGSVQVAAGEPAAALVNLDRAGEGSEAIRLKVRALIETGRYQDAAAGAAALLTLAPTNSNYVLAALANTLAGQTAVGTAFTARVTSPEAAQAIQRAAADNFTLAAELYANGLLRSSQRILLTLPQSYERNLLLSHIDYTFHTRASLTAAAGLLQVATAMNPAGLEARELLVSVDHDRGDTAAATAQTTLINKLNSGRP